jgi:nucleoside-diphosphate-sugar epimerase
LKAFVFGLGYVGSAYARRLLSLGWSVTGTSRDAEKRRALEAVGISAVDPDDRDQLRAAVQDVSAALVTAAPGPNGCPALNRLMRGQGIDQVFPDWLGYISSTSVYGDRDGGWVDEDSLLNAATVEGARRAAAERDWLEVGRGMGLTVCVFRLPGIYGPGRSPIDRIRAGTARRVRKPGQVFSRIHVEDAVDGLLASMARPRPGGVYNLCDDAPASADRVLETAARLLGAPTPPEVSLDDPSVTDAMRRFYLDNKRVSNARAKAELGWRPRHPTYEEGLASLL